VLQEDLYTAAVPATSYYSREHAIITPLVEMARPTGSRNFACLQPSPAQPSPCFFLPQKPQTAMAGLPLKWLGWLARVTLACLQPDAARLAPPTVGSAGRQAGSG
jgi:hypothetical protein